MATAPKFVAFVGLSACALLFLVRCFGDDPIGDAAPDSGVDAAQASDAASLPAGPFGRIQQIVAGEAFTCVRGLSGQVRCWGSNTQGQLGQERPDPFRSDVTATSTIPFGGLPKVVELAASFETVCARFEDLTVRCWGANTAGERGSGDKTAAGTAAGMATLPRVELGAGRTADHVVAGTRHFCVVVHNAGSVLCWGNGQDQSKRYGWLGTGQSNTIGDENGEMGDPLVVVPLAEPTTGLALGFTSTCALSTTGNVRCFGTGRGGQLGNGDPDAGADVHDVATAAITATGVTSLFGHGPAYAALLADAGAITWGDDADGRLGLGDGLDRIAPVPLPAKAAVLAVSSASSHRCVILVGGDLYCAGNGEYGKLGYGDTLSRGATPETGFVGQLQPVLSKVALVALGGDHTCAVLEDDGVVCWGLNANGQLGTRDTNDLGGTPTTPASRLSPIRME